MSSLGLYYGTEEASEGVDEGHVEGRDPTHRRHVDGPEEPVVIRTGQGMRSTNTVLDRDDSPSFLSI